MPWAVYVVDIEDEISTFIDEFTDEGDAHKARLRVLAEIDEEDEDNTSVEVRESK